MKLSLLTKYIFSLVLILAFVWTPVSPAFAPREAEAQMVVLDKLNLVKTTITATAAKVANKLTDAAIIKEYTLDGIAWRAGNILIEQMLRSTIDWVNSGFEGKPVFVQDFNSFLLDVGDRYALGFIWDNNLVDLCSPFKFNVQSALETQYSQSRGYYAECRISDAIGNLKGLEDFHNGNFISGGGWDAWHDVTMNPKMYADGALLEASIGLSGGLNGARSQANLEIEIGRGFLSQKRCDGMGENCQIITPGAAIQDQLNTALGAGAARLTIADELDELLGALVGQLAGNILGGGGIIGAGSRGPSSGSNSYYTELRNTPTQSHEVETDINKLEEEANNDIQSYTGTDEEEYAKLKNDYVVLLSKAGQLILSCDTSKVQPSLRDQLKSKLTELQNEATRVLSDNKTITIKTYEDFRDIYFGQIERTVENVPDSAGCDI